MCCGYFGDTWVWNGTNWTQEFPANSPSARGAFGMAYDAAQNQVVLFGGFGGISDLNDTWVWDGTNWTQLSPANSPPARAAFVMVYDAAQGQVVLFGGLNSGNDLNDTWVWDGTNWTEEFPASSPSPRSDFDMAYDTVHGQVVLFGGSNGSATPLNDTWVWDGTNWTQEFAASSPSGRVWADMAYDPQQSQAVLFGGLNGDFFNDTWVYEPQLTASPSSLNFGSRDIDGSHPMLVAVENVSATEVTVGTASITSTGGDPTAFTFYEYCKPLTLKAGHKCYIGVTFKPHEAGLSTATLSIPFSGPGSPLEVSIAGTGVERKK